MGITIKKSLIINHNCFSHCDSPFRMMTASENGDTRFKDKPLFKD